MIKAILFDLWNTLVYDSRNKGKKLTDSFREMGIDNPTDFIDNFLCTKYFHDVHDTANYISRKVSCDKQRVLEFVIEHLHQKATVFPDVAPALESLRKNYKLAIVSNFINLTADSVRKSGIERFFEYIFYSCNLGMIKQSGLFKHALKEMGVKPREAVMVGDCKFVDIDPAEGIGIRAVLIKREGFPLGYVERQNFRRTIKTLDELDRYLRP